MMKLSLEYPLEFAVTRPFFYNIIQAVEDEGNRVHSMSLFNGHVIEPKI